MGNFIPYYAINKQVQDAKEILRDNGYFVDNLWHVEDVLDKFECTPDEAQDILGHALTNDATVQQIWMAIDIAAESVL